MTQEQDPTLTSLEASEGQAGGADAAVDLLGPSVSAGSARKRLSRSSLVLIGTVACSTLLVAGMRYLGMGPGTSLAEAVKIDYDVTKAPPQGDHERVLNELSTANAAQVPPENVQRNPFMLAGALRSLEVQTPGVVDDSQARSERAKREEAEKARKAAEERQRALDTALGSLSVHGVIGGAVPMARISGQTVRVGETVGEFFKVVEIKGRTVTVEADGKRHELVMGDGHGQGAPPARRP